MGKSYTPLHHHSNCCPSKGPVHLYLSFILKLHTSRCCAFMDIVFKTSYFQSSSQAIGVAVNKINKDYLMKYIKEYEQAHVCNKILSRY